MVFTRLCENRPVRVKESLMNGLSQYHFGRKAYLVACPTIRPPTSLRSPLPEHAYAQKGWLTGLRNESRVLRAIFAEQGNYSLGGSSAGGVASTICHGHSACQAQRTGTACVCLPDGGGNYATICLLQGRTDRFSCIFPRRSDGYAVSFGEPLSERH
jgi:hypothetical protein